jgi:hypothetical protein
VSPSLSDSRFASDAHFPYRQVLRLIEAAIARHDLNLRGLTVLTEAAVGYQRVTPVLAALAGADAVYAVGRDTASAARRDAEQQTAFLARAAAVIDRVHLVSTRLQAPLAGVDIITSLPGVRPIDESVLRSLPTTAVVTLMAAATAWQPGDVDVAACRRMGIAVAGVDEDGLDLYRYAPLPTLAMLLQLGVGIVGTTLLVAGDGLVLAKVVRALSALGARVLVAAAESTGRLSLCGGEKIGDSLADVSGQGRLAECDALLLYAADPTHIFIGAGGEVTARELAQQAPHLAIVCSSGLCDRRSLSEAGLRHLPAGPDLTAATALPGDLTPEPVIELHAAGLKVGQALAHARRRGSSPLVAESFAAQTAHADQLPKDLPRSRRPA